MRDLDRLATLLIASRLVEDSEARPFTPARFWSLLDSVPNPGAMFDATPGEIGSMTGLSEEDSRMVSELLASGTALALTLQELQQTGIAALTPFDEGYPARFRSRLGTQAPPVVFCAGDADLLNVPALGIVGSREVDEAAVEVAREAARAALRREMGVVSGGARGIDQVAMQTIYEEGGMVLGVLAEALRMRLRDAQTRAAVLEGRAVLITPFHPDTGFTVQGAMGRNKLIYALSEVTFLVTTSNAKGGTWAGATEALKRGYAPVTVWAGNGKGTGNDELVKLGARPITEIDDLFAPGFDAGFDPEQLGFAL